ncbi:MAG TPA: metalloregulator ArsR/SmtB family transcription factor [Chloroflexia bacterium]|nr:metalloregulator ArsR/SmtB family transcription factor [Chloroflexia bacterium]
MEAGPQNITGEESPTGKEQAKQESLKIAANYLGYDRVEMTPDLLNQKRAKMRDNADFLRAFSDESRLDILIFLMHSGGQKEMPKYSVSEIATRFNISMSTVSHHLQELKRVGIVRVERSGKERYYQLDLDYVIEWFGEWYRRLLYKRELLRAGSHDCPHDITLEELIKRGTSEGKEAPPAVRN